MGVGEPRRASLLNPPTRGWLWVTINKPGIRPQILVHISIYQGNPFWVYRIFDPRPGSPFLLHGTKVPVAQERHTTELELQRLREEPSERFSGRVASWRWWQVGAGCKSPLVLAFPLKEPQQLQFDSRWARWSSFRVGFVVRLLGDKPIYRSRPKAPCH